MPLPIFTIIVPIYNVGEWLRPCLNSILSQTFLEWEAILVDDGSNDGSEAICDEYAHLDSRFRVTHQVNQGVAVARNTGLKTALGEWIWCVDADDVIHPEALRVLSAFTEDCCKYNIVYFDFINDTKINFPSLNGKEPQEYIEINPKIPEMSAWRYVFKKQLLGDLRFFQYRVGEDLLFSAKLCSKSDSVVHLSLPLYGYVIRGTSVTKNPTLLTIQDSIRWMSDVLPVYAADDRFLHVYKHRWRMFLFILPMKIRVFSGSEYIALSRLWLEKLEAIQELPGGMIYRIWRGIIVNAYQFSFALGRLFFAINAMIGKWYLNARHIRRSVSLI